MTSPKPETIEKEKDKFFLTDAELIRKLGVPEPAARTAIDFYEKKGGFPPKEAMWGGRRYWPAIEAWLNRQHGLTMPADQPRRIANGR